MVLWWNSGTSSTLVGRVLHILKFYELGNSSCSECLLTNSKSSAASTLFLKYSSSYNSTLASDQLAFKFPSSYLALTYATGSNVYRSCSSIFLTSTTSQHEPVGSIARSRQHHSTHKQPTDLSTTANESTRSSKRAPTRSRLRHHLVAHILGCDWFFSTTS